eukprot:g2990.t1
MSSLSLPDGFQVTVFTLKTCKHCVKAKALLNSIQIPYVEIYVSNSKYRERMTTLVPSAQTVPQIFVMNEHIGGCDSLLEKMKRNEFIPLLEKLLKSFVSDANVSTNVLSPLLRLNAADREAMEEERKKGTNIEFPKPWNEKLDIASSDQKYPNLNSKLELLNYLRTHEVVEQWSVTDHLSETTGASSEQQPQKYCLTQSDIDILFPNAAYGKNDHLGNNSRLIKDIVNSRHILNSIFEWKANFEESTSDGTLENPNKYLARLKLALDAVLARHTDPQSGNVDHDLVRKDKQFLEFEYATCRLQRVNIVSQLPDGPERVAFFINLYNVLMLHAMVRIGYAQNKQQRSTYFKDMKYQIGIFSLSLDDIEHGILRGNKNFNQTTTHTWSRQEGLYGPKEENIEERQMKLNDLSCKSPDPRVHFALNCGAKSCPMVKSYSPGTLDAELDIAAKAFFRSNVEVKLECWKPDMKQFYQSSPDGTQLSLSSPIPPPSSSMYRLRVKLSKILFWYRNDFGTTDHSMLERIASFIPSLKKALDIISVEKSLLEKTAGGEGPLSAVQIETDVTHFEYDWSANVENGREYNSSIYFHYL